MQNGYVVLQSNVLLLIGVAGAGKTSFCHLIFGEPPPPVRESTPLAKSSIRALAITKAIISGQKEVIWKRISQKDFRVLIADAVKGLSGLESKYQNFQSNINEQHSETEYEIITLYQTFKKYGARQLWSLLGKVISPKFIHELQTEENLQQSNTINQDNSPNIEEGQGRDGDINTESKDSQVCANIGHLFELEPVKQIIELINHSKGSEELFQQNGCI